MDSKTIGERLRQLRGNMTAKELAEKLKTSESAIFMWESGSRIPRDEIKKRIAKQFKVTVESIFFTD